MFVLRNSDVEVSDRDQCSLHSNRVTLKSRLTWEHDEQANPASQPLLDRTEQLRSQFYCALIESVERDTRAFDPNMPT